MHREPTLDEVVSYMCAIQPEIDEKAARRLLSLDPAISEGIAQAYAEQRDRAEAILELHLSLEEITA